MREFRTSGSVRGAASNGRPYRELSHARLGNGKIGSTPPFVRLRPLSIQGGAIPAGWPRPRHVSDLQADSRGTHFGARRLHGKRPFVVFAG